jgi:hypothetical protein
LSTFINIRLNERPTLARAYLLVSMWAMQIIFNEIRNETIVFASAENEIHIFIRDVDRLLQLITLLIISTCDSQVPSLKICNFIKCLHTVNYFVNR